MDRQNNGNAGAGREIVHVVFSPEDTARIAKESNKKIVGIFLFSDRNITNRQCFARRGGERGACGEARGEGDARGASGEAR